MADPVLIVWIGLILLGRRTGSGNMKILPFFLALTLSLSISPVRAQVPPPVDLGIQNIPQETPLWCWAAVAQQIIFALRGPNGTPHQCGLVAIARAFLI